MKINLDFWQNAVPTTPKNEVSIKDLFSKYEKSRSFQRIWSHLLKKSLKKNFTSCAVLIVLS